MSNFESLKKARHITLKTFRKSGEGVSTPVWFAEENGKLYVYSSLDTGKVKRIRNNNQAEIAPCNFRGVITEGASYIPVTVRLITDMDEAKHANQLLNRKYGLLKRVIDMTNPPKPDNTVYIEISLN